MKALIGLTLTLFAQAMFCSGQITIGTLSDWNGTSVSSLAFGASNPPVIYTTASTWGQTFTVPTGDPTLQNFSMWLLNLESSIPLVFDGYFMRWNGTQATGPVLYDSGPVTLGTGNTFHQISCDQMNLLLTPGQQYVFFLSTSPYASGPEGAAYVGSMLFSSYTGGVEVNINNGANLSAWTNQAWGQGSLALGNDTAFEAQFTVPEPSLAGLLALGFGFLLLGRFPMNRRASVGA